MKVRIGCITGTGFYRFEGFEEAEVHHITTPYGDVDVEIGRLQGTPVVLIPRHGKDHSIAPAEINVRANLSALHSLGVEYILGTSVSGSLERRWPPGTLVLMEQFLNFTAGRKDTFYPVNGRIAHIDVTHPYCPTIGAILLEQSQKLGLRIETGGVYACTNGPRFETAAEIEMIRRSGGNLVGHTNYPECVLARELAICYATVGVVSNYAAGMTPAELTATEIKENIASLGGKIAALFEGTMAELPVKRDDICSHALDEAYL